MYDDESIMVACSGSLMKAMRNLEVRFSVPPARESRLQDRLAAQVQEIVRHAAKTAFQQGFQVGAQAGVRAFAPAGHWETILVTPLNPCHIINVDGIQPFLCTPRPVRVEGEEK